MPIRTIAAILGGEQGGPGFVIGTGSLMTARSVLVHPPLSQALASGAIEHAGLRVCLTTWADGTARAEIVDVVDMAVAGPEWGQLVGPVTAARNPLVALTLTTAVAMPLVPDLTPAPAVLAHLANPFDGSVSVGGPPPPGSNILCAILHFLC
jgi:hypothetical protein